MADVTALENRLKQVTARLEQVEKQLAAAGGAAAAPSSSSSGVSSAAGGAFVAAYDELVASTIDKYVTFSSSIDPIVKQQADLVKQAANAQRQFLQVASQSKKPGQNELAALLKGTSELMEKIADLRNKNRAHKMFNWLSAVSEGITAFGWVAVEPTPGPFVNEGRASSEFYSNKILMEFKTKEGGDLQRNWVGAWNGYLKELFNYIKQHHTTGVTWNAQGGDAPAGGPAAPSGGAPPPPPSGGPPAFDAPAPSSSAPVKDRGALLAEINLVKERQKGGRTEGLRKVTAEQKTKNRPAGESSVITSVGSKTAAPRAAARPAITRPPKFALESNKWVVEYQVGNPNIVIKDTETRHTVYVFKCENTVIQVKGKVNAITLDSCKKTGLVFENAIASCEVVNCQSVEIQVLGSVPALAVDKTDGCQIMLSNECLGVELVTSKCSEMNISIPSTSGGDPIEKPVPEQFKTMIKNGNLVTEAVQHLG
eukprot:TRINITY_DN319_c0_g1_i1.p1 TRINITY_DN319_c0_g1~~TRINITY_DN319_c0_g1_i1.p1  ORF type:complete len:482 (-),score=164.19 TRINITY_DN319_c0_g1_i1:65-1510(-)